MYTHVTVYTDENNDITGWLPCDCNLDPIADPDDDDIIQIAVEAHDANAYELIGDANVMNGMIDRIIVCLITNGITPQVARTELGILSLRVHPSHHETLMPLVDEALKNVPNVITI